MFEKLITSCRVFIMVYIYIGWVHTSSAEMCWMVSAAALTGP